MDQINAFISSHLPFLRQTNVYKVTKSMQTTANGGDSLLEYDSAGLQFRFITDRGQLFLDIRPPHSSKEKDWYSIDIVYRLLTGANPGTSIVNPGFAEFILTRLQDIETLFSVDQWPQTEKKLTDLERKRSKEMFG